MRRRQQRAQRKATIRRAIASAFTASACYDARPSNAMRSCPPSRGNCAVAVQVQQAVTPDRVHHGGRYAYQSFVLRMFLHRSCDRQQHAACSRPALSRHVSVRRTPASRQPSRRHAAATKAVTASAQMHPPAGREQRYVGGGEDQQPPAMRESRSAITCARRQGVECHTHAANNVTTRRRIPLANSS